MAQVVQPRKKNSEIFIKQIIYVPHHHPPVEKEKPPLPGVDPRWEGGVVESGTVSRPNISTESIALKNIHINMIKVDQ